MEVLDKIIEVKTYTSLMEYFTEVLNLLGKTKIKKVLGSPASFDLSDQEIYIIFEDGRCLVISGFLTSLGQFELQSEFHYWEYVVVEPYELKDLGKVLNGHYFRRVKAVKFSEGFEINGVTGETCPDSGDYFGTVSLIMENKSVFKFRGCEALIDGYMYFQVKEKLPKVIEDDLMNN